MSNASRTLRFTTTSGVSQAAIATSFTWESRARTLDETIADHEEEPRMPTPHPIIGHVPDVAVGTEYANRRPLADAGVHRMRMHGIAWSTHGPAESIVQSGGYEDDEDWGDTLLYTGMGGNHDGRQVADQELRAGNLALVRSLELQTPVRVVRGANHIGPYSPREGYRYDGLFRVIDAFFERGRAGFFVWRFVLQRADVAIAVPPPTRMQRRVIDIYDGACQVCGYTPRRRSGLAALPWHLQPLHRPHGGNDVLANLLCLCPTHAQELDAGVLRVAEDGKLLGTLGRLHLVGDHRLDPAALRYRHERYWAASG